MSSGDEKPGGDISWKQAVTLVGLALGIPWMILVPALLGWWIDKRFDTWPVWFLVLLLVGLLGTAFDVYKLLKRFGQFK